MNIPRLRLQHRWQWKKRRLPLRLRLALWSAGLVLVLSFGLLLFINSAAIASFPRVIRGNQVRIDINRRRLTNPLEAALFLELRNISLIGLVLVAGLGGVGAYWLAGIALRPVRKVGDAARRISANTLDTRLAVGGPKDEVKEMADTFDAMLERLERTFEAQGCFVADVAHELRTPLASLRTNLEVVTTDSDATLEDYQAMVATQERASLGIIIGVGAVILMISISESSAASINQHLSGLSPNELIIRSGSTRSSGVNQGAGTQQTLSQGDADAISSQVANVAAVSPVVNASGQVVFRNQNWATSVQGVYPTCQQIGSWQMQEGTFFLSSDEQSVNSVAVIGQTVADNLFTPLGVDPIGQQIRIRNVPFTVIGVLTP